jgi:protoporphyrinogen oxidase
MSGDPGGRTVVVGAGVAGLVVADALARAGREVVVLEREDRVGGLARSFARDGFIFDVGPHRFHTDSPEVGAYVLDVLGDDHRTIEWRSAVRMFGAFLEWPLRASALPRMPASVLLGVARDALRRPGGDPERFDAWVRARYGETLYRIFFAPYTEKFLGVRCDAISRDWAVTGVERAVIDAARPLMDLRALAASLLRPRRPLRFVYPQSGGIQVFCDRLRRRVEERGGRVVTGAPVEAVQRGAGGITAVVAAGEALACARVVWTGELDPLLAMLDEPATGLEYRSLVTLQYRLSRRALTDHQWCYFGAPDVPFSRVSLPARFNPALAPAGRDGVCVEVTCRRGEPAWEDPGSLDAAVRRGLVAGEVVESGADFAGVTFERFPSAYPIYALGYRARLHDALRAVARHRNVVTLGRTGGFWYNNMDHSITAGLALARTLVAGG